MKRHYYRDRRWLGHVSFTSGQMSFTPNPRTQEGEAESSHQQCLEAATQTLASAAKLAARENVPDQTVAFPASVSELRWFLTPSEAKACLLGEPVTAATLPFSPPPTARVSAAPCPGTLSAAPRVSPHTASLLATSAASWTPSLARSGISVVGRQSIRRPPDHASLQRSDSVTVNGCTTVNVNSESNVSNGNNTCQITVNGFKNVINLTSNGVQLTFAVLNLLSALFSKTWYSQYF